MLTHTLPQASDAADPVVTDFLLAEKGKKFNRLFRQAAITDSKRPAVIGALMLALWRAGKREDGKLDTADQIKTHAVQYCEEAFSHANDPRLAEALVSELKVMLSQRDGPKAAKEILDDLRFLGVGVHRMSDGADVSVSADFLGQLYEVSLLFAF